MSKVGVVRRTGLPWGHQHYETDGQAIRLEFGDQIPNVIYRPSGPRNVTRPGIARKGDVLCFSGVTTNRVKCGVTDGVSVLHLLNDNNEESPGRLWEIHANLPIKHGDSGAPVWDRSNGRVVGLVSALGGYVAPIIHAPNLPTENSPGILDAPGMGALRLKQGN